MANYQNPIENTSHIQESPVLLRNLLMFVHFCIILTVGCDPRDETKSCFHPVLRASRKMINFTNLSEDFHIKRIRHICRLYQNGRSCMNRALKQYGGLTQAKSMDFLYLETVIKREHIVRICEKPDFQNDYMLHKRCFQRWHDDTDDCSRHHSNQMSDSKNLTFEAADLYLFNSGILFDWFQCVYAALHVHCGESGAQFFLETAQDVLPERRPVNEQSGEQNPRAKWMSFIMPNEPGELSTITLDEDKDDGPLDFALSNANANRPMMVNDAILIAGLTSCVIGLWTIWYALETM